MKYFFSSDIKPAAFRLFDLLIIILIAIVPLFLTFNYRLNIFLAWEGAYRMYLGQIPFKDFGMPVGFGFWILPALFFKLLGPQLITLVKAQVLINIISGISFRTILKNLNVNPGTITLSLLVFSISYTFLNPWPWYNHSVIVYQFAGLAFLTGAYTGNTTFKSIILYFLSTLFLALSVLTKQDAGILGIVISLVLTAVYAFKSNKWINLFYLLAGLLFWFLLFILPLNASFGYWFNYGQPPHNSRISFFDLTDEFFINSQWIRFYLVCLVVVACHRISMKTKIEIRELLFFLLTLGILAEAAVFQVTSYVPADNNIFFHSFVFAFLAWYLQKNHVIDVNKPVFFGIASLVVLLLWSSTYWHYTNRIFAGLRPTITSISATGENVVNKHNYMSYADTLHEADLPWKESSWKAFEKVRLPQSTIEGMERLKAMLQFKDAQNIRVLNMTELTPLAAELGFSLETGPDYPLWFHLGVSFFNKHLKEFDNRIDQKYYDVVLYEYIPALNNFYPFELRQRLKKEYKLEDQFLAPRRETTGIIEVYVKP